MRSKQSSVCKKSRRLKFGIKDNVDVEISLQLKLPARLVLNHSGSQGFTAETLAHLKSLVAYRSHNRILQQWEDRNEGHKNRQSVLPLLNVELLICMLLMLGSKLGCCGTTSAIPVWYMVRLAWVKMLLRHGDDMETLRNIQMTSWKRAASNSKIRYVWRLHLFVVIQLCKNQILYSNVCSNISIKEWTNLPDHSRSHNMMQRNSQRQSVVWACIL